MSEMQSKMGSGFESVNQAAEPMAEEGSKRGPKDRLPEDWFERVRRRVAEGEPVTCAIRTEGMGVSWFYERVGEKPELWDSLQKARQVKMEDVLENELCRLVFAGEGKPVYWKGYQVGEERHYSDGLLMFLLKTLLPEKYGNTKASAKRQAELKRKEQVFKKLLVDVQVALDDERRNRTEILAAAGMPVPPRRKAESGKASPCTPLPPGVGGEKGGEGGERTSEDRRQMSQDWSGAETAESEWTWDCSGDRPKRVRREKAESGKQKVEIGGASEGGAPVEGPGRMSEDRDQRSEDVSGGETVEEEQDKSMSKSKIKSKNGVSVDGGEEGGEPRAEGGDQRSEDRSQRSDQASEVGGGENTERGSEQDRIKIKSKIMIKNGVGSEDEGQIGQAEEGGAAVAGNTPKEEALPGGEDPRHEKELSRYDPYEVSRKIREAEKARRMRRRQIDF